MTRSNKLAVVTMAALMLASVLALVPGPVGATNDPTAPDYTVTGDWTVDFDSSFQDITINVTGMIYIYNDLTLKNVTLNLRPTANGTSGIRVFSGGGLYVLDNDDDNTTTDDASMITSDTAFRYWFRVNNGATIVIKNSYIDHCGYDPSNYVATNAGLYILAPNAHIENNIFNDSVTGVQMWGGSDNGFVAGNTVYGSNTLYGMRFMDSTDTLAENNTIYDCTYGIYASTLDGLDLLNNTIIDPSIGILTDEVVNMMIMDNTVSGAVLDGARLNDTNDSNLFTNSFSNGIGDLGMRITNSTGDYLEGNDLNDNPTGGLRIESSSDIEFVLNTIDNNGVTGVFLGAGTDAVSFDRDSITDNGNYGLYVDGATDVIIENGTMTGHAVDDITVRSSGIATALNSSFGNGNTNAATGGELTVKWFLHFHVYDVLGDPIPGADVVIKDALDNTIRSATTDANGYLNWTQMVDLIQTTSGYDRTMNAHVVTVNDGTKDQVQSVDMTNTMLVGMEFNYAPTTTLSNVFDMDEDTIEMIDLAGNFSDLDTISYSAWGYDHVAVVVNNVVGTAHLTPEANWYGQEYVNFSAIDTRGLRAQVEVLVTVENIGDAPTIVDIPDQRADEDAIAWDVNLTDYVLDVDLPNDVLKWYIDGADYSLCSYDIDDFTGKLNIDPIQNAYGEDELTIRVEDSFGLSDSQNITVTLDSVNDLPIITSYPDEWTRVGETYSYDVQASDVDDPDLVYSLDSPPTGMDIDSSNGLITWEPVEGQEDTHYIVVIVSDGEAQVQQDYYLTVDERYNDPPYVTSYPDTSVHVGENFTYLVEANDNQDDPITFSLESAPEGMTIDTNTGLIQWVPTQAQVGWQSVQVRVSDPYEYSEHSFSIEVEPADMPDISFLTPYNGQRVKKTVEITGRVSVGTYDIDKIEIKIDEGIWNEVEGTSYYWMYEWNSRSYKNGDHEITVRVFDTEGNIDIASITVDVRNYEEPTGLAGFGDAAFFIVLALLLIGIIALAMFLAFRKGSGHDHYHHPSQGQAGAYQPAPPATVEGQAPPTTTPPPPEAPKPEASPEPPAETTPDSPNLPAEPPQTEPSAPSETIEPSTPTPEATGPQVDGPETGQDGPPSS